MKKHKKKKVILLLVLWLLLIAVFLSYKNCDYPIIAQSKNENYAGIGQEKISRQDGYFTTFTTVEEYKKIYKEYKQNGTSSWSEHEYWDGTMSDNGCGITALSIILSGYSQDYTPEDLRQKYFPVMDSDKISSELKYTFGIKNSNFFYDKEHLSNEHIEKHLESNRPVLICVWTKPTANRWTTASHFMVLLATDNNGMVYISNPNGQNYTSKSSGWYDINEVTPYIAKALFIESYN